MKITLTMEQLNDLLYEQKSKCKWEFDKLWNASEVRRQLLELDPQEKILLKMHEVRDKIEGAEFPDDVKVLLKYNINS